MSERFNYINEGNFVLFREHNDPNSRRPVMKGKIEFDDGRPTLFVSAWAKEKNGKKYLSGTVESRHERADGPPPAQDQQAPPASFKDDEIPF